VPIDPVEAGKSKLFSLFSQLKKPPPHAPPPPPPPAPPAPASAASPSAAAPSAAPSPNGQAATPPSPAPPPPPEPPPPPAGPITFALAAEKPKERKSIEAVEFVLGPSDAEIEAASAE
jgi:hypothetical protein